MKRKNRKLTAEKLHRKEKRLLAKLFPIHTRTTQWLDNCQFYVAGRLQSISYWRIAYRRKLRS